MPHPVNGETRKAMNFGRIVHDKPPDGLPVATGWCVPRDIEDRLEGFPWDWLVRIMSHRTPRFQVPAERIGRRLSGLL
jgi:hypothetical protein